MGGCRFRQIYVLAVMIRLFVLVLAVMIRLFVLVLAVMMLQSMPLNKKTVQACARSDSSYTLSPF